MRRKIKKMARMLRRNGSGAVWPLRAIKMKWIIATLTLPTVLSGCAHQSPSAPPQTVAAPAPRKVFFYAKRTKAWTREIGAFDGSPPQAIDLPASDYLVVEEIVSRRARIAQREQQERLAQEQAKSALEEAEATTAERPGKQFRNGKNRFFAKGRLIERLRRGKAEPSAIPPGPEKLLATRGWIGKPGKDGLWQQVRANLMLAGVEHQRVDAQIAEFRKHPGRTTYLAQRAQPYLPHIVGEIGRRGLPADLVLVPMVESGFQPTALSPKAAAGLWQIIPSTGVEHGLTVSETYDGRYDVRASTKAALSYFQRLIGLFKGDWLLALAAYNCGEGAVQRAIAANQKAGKGTSFWDLNLPAETEAYVPKIVALARVFASPESFGLKARVVNKTPVLAAVELSPEVRLVDAVAASGLSPEEFFRLNPAFKPDVEPPAQNYSVMLPVGKAQALAANLPGAKFLGTKTIVVKKGDTLARLAKRHGVPKLKLAQWNGLTPETPLTPGQELVVFPA